MKELIAIVVVLLTLELVYSAEGVKVHYSEKGCEVCGIKTQYRRNFVNTESFSNEELKNAFGKTIIQGKLCKKCARAVYRWRKEGKSILVRPKI